MKASVEVSALTAIREIHIELIEILRDDSIKVNEQFSKIEKLAEDLRVQKYIFDDEKKLQDFYNSFKDLVQKVLVFKKEDLRL